MEPYRSHFPHASLLLPHTEEVARRVLVLPTGTAIGPEEIEGICEIIRTALAQAGAVRMALSADERDIAVPIQPSPAARTTPGLKPTHDGLASRHQEADRLGAASKKPD